MTAHRSRALPVAAGATATLALLAVLTAALLTLAIAPAAGPPGARDRAGAFFSSAPTCTRGSGWESACTRPGFSSPTARITVGCCVAAKAGDAARAAPKALGPGTSVGPKIERQLPGRGWTQRLVQSTIDDPVRTVPWRDTRHLRGGGRMDDPATGYYSRRGGYLVRNDRTGDIVQVSDRTNPAWRAPWDR